MVSPPAIAGPHGREIIKDPDRTPVKPAHTADNEVEVESRHCSGPGTRGTLSATVRDRPGGH